MNTEIHSIKLRFGIIGNSPALLHAIQVAWQVAPTEMTVLITGESGVGKESFSKIIHQNSPRKHGKFIAINCGAIPEGTIDSELFGHEKGSFTGANDSRKGYFEVTDGGTIFLDEVGEMPLGTQARLLRVLENGEFIKVGSSNVQRTNVRVVAATNVNLYEAVQKGKFREDLYYRLNTVPIYVPPLREREDDVKLLFRKFAGDFAEKYRVKPIKLTTEAEEVLKRYRFPGNIRQLKNIVEQISVLEMEREVDSKTLSNYLPSQNTSPALYNGVEGGDKGFSERDLLYQVLFDMKKDMNELKKMVYSLASSDENGDDLLKDNAALFRSIDAEDEHGNTGGTRLEHTLLLGERQRRMRQQEEEEEDDEYQRIEDIPHEEDEEESLSLEKKEKELIIKALKKHRNRRKHAADDLGISERTLYRKIKQYELE